MAVPSVNIVIEKETDFSNNFKLKKDGDPIDLTTCTFVSKIKKHYSSSTSYNFTVNKLAPYNLGYINVSMASSITETIPEGRYVYDVLMTLSGSTTKVIQGNLLVRGTAS